MTGTETVAERLREIKGASLPCRGDILAFALGRKLDCPIGEDCINCIGRLANELADAIEAEQRSKTEQNGVDVGALLKLADYLSVRTSYDPQGDRCIADNIRDAVKGATFEQAKPQLPEGIEWPRFEDGELVRLGDEFEFDGIKHTVDMIRFQVYSDEIEPTTTLLDLEWVPVGYKSGARVKRPEPEVLDADGVPIKVGDTVWDSNGESHEVVEINVVDDDEQLIWCGRYLHGMKIFHIANEVTHRKPDTLESIFSEIVSAIESEDLVDLAPYVERYRKLKGGE